MGANKCPWISATSGGSAHARQKCFGVDGRFYICLDCDARKAIAINRLDDGCLEVLQDYVARLAPLCLSRA